MLASERFSVAGKTAIVTGASAGLGVTMAEVLAGAGANVVLAARRVEPMEALARRIEDAGGTAMVAPCDVADVEAIRAMVAAAWGRFGRVDILVNNAGIAGDAGVMPERCPEDIFEQTIRVNLIGTFACARAVAERQLADGKGGSIINISSIAGVAGLSNFPAAYQASKGGVINLTRNLAATWADRGVRVNCIAPGWFPSEMTEGWFAIPQFLERFTGQSPMLRIGDPDELAGPLLFLASDASSFVTGQVLAVDGGLSATTGGTPYTDELFGLQASVVPGGLGERILPA
jgi:NAD(P)-dependent dehydrogenase (short-subunit alcohol dehydrogenase family)